MKLLKLTSLLSYIIILSMLFTSVVPVIAFAEENEALVEETDSKNEAELLTENTEEEIKPEIMIEENEEDEDETSEFRDVSHMSDEEFFGEWDAETESWKIEGKINYNYSSELSEVERLVKLNSYSMAKEALLEYYRNRTSIPRADFNSGVQWERNTLNSRDAYSFEETYLSYTNVTSVGEYEEYTVDLGETSASVFLLSSITKTVDMVCIASRESEYTPTLEIVRKDGSSFTLYPIRDTYIRGYDNKADYSKRVYGDSDKLYVKDSWYQNSEGRYLPYSSKSRRAYIAFDSNDIPKDAERVYLRFYAKIVPEEGTEETTETDHEILVFNAYNKTWSETEGENGTFAPMTWAGYRISHYSWNGLPGGFDWIQPDNVPSEFFRDNTRWSGAGSMARTSLLTGNTEYMRKSMEIVLDFIEDTNGKIVEGNVPEKRDIESANRCCEITGIFAAYLDSNLFNAEAMTAILKWMWEEMTYLYNGAGILYEGATAIPTANNYAETNRGLWHVKGMEGVCTYFPEFADRDMWKELANERLYVVTHVLVNDDGCYQEATFGYANTMINYFLAIYKFLQDSGDSIPDWYSERLGNFVKFLMYNSYPNHKTPYLGEGGAPNTTNALSKYLDREYDPEIEYVVTNGQEGTMPAQTSAYFKQLKMAACRTGWSTEDSMLFMTAKNGGNHNHKDSLMITFFAGDRELLADTGMTSYDSLHPHFQWQRHTTRSHNTIEIDETAQRGTNFLYNNNPSQPNGEASLKLFSSIPVDRIVAWTDANEGFRHYRNVSYIKNHNFIIVSDMISPDDEEEHTYTQNWHTGTDSPSNSSVDDTTKVGKTNYHTGSNLIIAQANTENIELTLEKGFSSLTPVPTDYFCYTQVASGDVMYNTVLYPTQEGTTSNIGVKNIETGVDPAVASAMDINLFKDNDDVLNVFYYNSFEETPKERSFNGYTTNSSNVTIQQDIDGNPSFLSMYNGSLVIRNGEELITSDRVLEDIEIAFDGDSAEITSKDDNIESARLIFKAPVKIRKLTINGASADYVYSEGKVYVNNSNKVDFSGNKGYFVSLTAIGEKGAEYPFTIDIPADSVISGALTMPTCIYSDGAFTVNFGNAVLSSCAKIFAGGHSGETVKANLEGENKTIVKTITVNSDRQYADNRVTSGAPVLERTREDLVIWTKDATDFVIGESSDESYGKDERPSGGGGGGGAGDAKPLPKPDENTENAPQESLEISVPKDDSEKTVVFEDCIGHWASEDINYMYQNGYINGISETAFDPDSIVTRAEFAAIAVRILGLQQEEYSGVFDDIGADDWYANVVEMAYKAGIIQGSNGKYRPNDGITREEMAVILMRIYRLNQDYTAQTSAEFTDYREISSWATEAVNSACELGFIRGMDNYTFAPSLNTTRAQAVAVFRRLLMQQVKEG